MNKLTALTAWAESRRDVWLDCVRIYLGLGLFARGCLIVFNVRTEFFVNLLSKSNSDWLLSAALLHYIALAHFLGGLMLAAGFLTRVAALAQIPILAGAVFIVHRQDGLFALGQSLEFSALVLFLLVVVLVAGAGPLSLDRFVFGAAPKASPPSALPQP